MKDQHISGEAPFTIHTPYRWIERGRGGKKPLIVYLHGFNQNIEGFQKKTGELLDLEGYHLFIQAPYPVYSRSNQKKKVAEWGRSWYWYDGEQDHFVKSLERASGFIEGVTEKMAGTRPFSRICLFGYSMGGYLAGYFALSRRKQVNDLVVIGARIKTEIFEEREKDYEHLKVLALNGKRDKQVKGEAQKESCRRLASWKAAVTFKEPDAAHALSDVYLMEAKNWLLSQGYEMPYEGAGR